MEKYHEQKKRIAIRRKEKGKKGVFSDRGAIPFDLFGLCVSGSIMYLSQTPCVIDENIS
jgi:hypothetical protein